MKGCVSIFPPVLFIDCTRKDHVLFFNILFEPKWLFVCQKKKKERGKVIQRGSADTVVFLRLYFCSCRWIVLQGVDLAAFIG